MMAKACALLVFFAAAQPSPPPPRLAAALSQYRQGKSGPALEALLKIIADDPGSRDADDAVRYVWQIAGSIQKSEKALTLDPARWRHTVATARSIAGRRRREADKTLAQAERLATELPTSAAPLDVLRRAPLWEAGADPGALDELSRLKAGQYLSAIRQSLKQLSEKPSPDAASLHEIKGYFWIYQGDFELAVSEWAEASRLKPMDAELSERLSLLKSRWESQKKREDAEHELGLAIGDFKSGSYQKALERAQRAAAMDPASEEARRYAKLAKSALEDAARQERVAALLNEGRSRYQQGRLFEAVQSWVDTLVLDPSNVEARRELERIRARLLAAQAAPKPAAPVAKNPAPAPPVDSSQAEESYSLGLIYYNDGELERARAAFAEALRRKPDHARARKALEQVDAELKSR